MISEKDSERLRELARRHPKLFRGLVLPWFTAEGWTKILSAAADRENLHDTHAEFERASQAGYEKLVAAGHPVEKVVIDADALIAWCRSENRPLDAIARQLFAAMTLVKRDEGAGHA